LAVQQLHRSFGRSQSARSNPIRFGALACFRPFRKPIPKRRRAFGRSDKDCKYWGGSEGRNLRIDLRWGGPDPDRSRALAAELLSQAPDLIVVGNPVPLAAVLQQSRSVPIVFVSMSDPVEGGFVQSFSHPGGSVTGFTNFETKLL
jgi:hypothetical protein